MQPKQLLQAINRWENVLIEAIAISVIFISAVVTANYFGWTDADPTVKAASVVYAFGVDGMFYICVRLARHYLSFGLTWRGVCLGLFWMALSIGMGAFTWHNNLLFAANAWHLDPAALARAGVNDTQELHLHAIIPVVVVLIVALIPRRKAKDERTPEQILADAKQQKALLEAKNMLRSVNAQGAGAGVRSVVGGFFGQALNLEEKHKQEAQAKRARKTRNDERAQMRTLADAALLSECEDEDGTLDYPLLEARLKEAGLWPPSIAKLNADAQASSEVEVSDPDMDAVTPLGTRKWLTDEEVARELGISKYQAEKRMDPKYKGRFPRIKTHKFTVNGKAVRKAYYRDVDDLKPKGNTEPLRQVSVQLIEEPDSEVEE